MKKTLKIIIFIAVLIVIALTIFLMVYGLLPQDAAGGGSNCSGGSCTIG